MSELFIDRSRISNADLCYISMEDDLYARLCHELNLTPEERARYGGWEVSEGVLYPGQEEDMAAWEARGPKYCTATQVISELLQGSSDPRDQDLADYLAQLQ